MKEIPVLSLLSLGRRRNVDICSLNKEVDKKMINAITYNGLTTPITEGLLIKNKVLFKRYRNFDIFLSSKISGQTFVFCIELFSLIHDELNPVFNPGIFKYIESSTGLPIPPQSFARKADIFIEGNEGIENLITAERGEISIVKIGFNYIFSAALRVGNERIKVDYRNGFEIL